MEPTRGQILTFPVSQNQPQRSTLLAHWEVLHLHFQHELLRIYRLGALLTPGEVLILQGEWALLADRLDAIETAVKLRTLAHAKAAGLIA